MNGTLPGLLEDPNIHHHTLGLPTLNDVHIAPLRNPAPSRNGQAPLPLELIDSNYLNDNDRAASAHGAHHDDDNNANARARLTHSAPVDAASSSRERDVKKPHLAISELVDAPSERDHEHDNGQVQLPSFVSLSVVEKSPTQKQRGLNSDFPNKRPRLEADSDLSAHDVNRLLPRPIQKDGKHVRPLLPSMVTGLHEPPPSAGILPSIELDSRPSMQQRSATSASKMQVKDMLLLETQRSSYGRPPEQMLNTPEVATAELHKAAETDAPSTDVDTPSTTASIAPSSIQAPPKDQKVRRIRRKWSQAETDDLLAGVKKHGFGKWKQILIDPDYTFVDRTSIDLKDRFRVFAREYPDASAEASQDDVQPDSADPAADPSQFRFRSNAAAANTNQLKPQRRKRHPWTREEDQALLAGVQKYGFQWTDIHNDPDLNLSHRRATDLRDRIRNLYPDSYKHAEARPLRAEVKKAEKAGKKETPAGTLYAPPAQMESINFPAPSPPTPRDPHAGVAGTVSAGRAIARRQTTSGRVPSIAALTSAATEETDANRPLAPRRSKTVAESDRDRDRDHAGITLPSLALDVAGDADAWDNTLPPFINWEV